MDLKTLYALKPRRDGDDPAAYDATVAALGGGAIYRIPSENFSKFEHRFARIVKAAEKIGVTVPTFEAQGPVDESYERPDGLGGTEVVLREAYYVHVLGEAPRLAGWRFVATIEYDGESGKSILRTVPGIEIDLAEYREADPRWCDHCQLDRRRKETFVVVHDDGSRKRVGRQCLKDFLGHADPETVARWLEMLLGLDEYLGGYDDDEMFFGGGRQAWHVEDVLAVTGAVVDSIGWVSKSKAEFGEQPTAGVVMDELDPPKGQKPKYGLSERNVAEAKEAVEWMRALGERERISDYEWNLSVASEADYITARRVAIVASGLVAYRREQEREVKLRARAERCNEWFGEVGERLRGLEVTVTSVRHGEGNYGEWTLLVMTDPDGRTFKWFASGAWDVAAGDRAVLDATVKGHETWVTDSGFELRETILTRGKVKSEFEAAA